MEAEGHDAMGYVSSHRSYRNVSAVNTRKCQHTGNRTLAKNSALQILEINNRSGLCVCTRGAVLQFDSVSKQICARVTKCTIRVVCVWG